MRSGADPGNLKGGSFTGAVTPTFRPSPVLGLTHCEAAHWFPLQIPGDIVEFYFVNDNF